MTKNTKTYDFDHKTFQETSLILVNDLRDQHGMRPLAWSHILHPGARIRAEELRDYGSVLVDGKPHRRPDGSSYTQAFEDVLEGGQISYIGENLVYHGGFLVDTRVDKSQMANQIAVTLFHMWENSEGHLANMVNPNYDQASVALGVEYYLEKSRLGYVRARLFGVQIFGG